MMLLFSNLTPFDLSQTHVDSIIDEKYTKNDFYESQKGTAQDDYIFQEEFISILIAIYR